MPFGKPVALVLSMPILLVFCLSCGDLHAQTEPQDTTKVLFLGSSYFGYNNLPNLFRNLADSAQRDVYIDQRIPSGIYLEDHANSSETEALIRDQKWDYVILQGVGQLMAYPDHFTDHPVYPALVTLRDMIADNCESTLMVFCMPWAFEDGMIWYGWDDTFNDMQILIYENTLQYSDEIGFAIAPVGWAWRTVLEELDYPLHYLHMSDWNHPSLRGSYLMTCVIFSTVFLESTVGLDYHAHLPADEVEHFRSVASSTVLDDIELWNIPAPTIGTPETSPPSGFRLEQNSPNPFNPQTTIHWSQKQAGPVSLGIIDLRGRLVKTLSNRHYSAGDHHLPWDGTDSSGAGVESGVFFYRLESAGQVETRSLVLVR